MSLTDAVIVAPEVVEVPEVPAVPAKVFDRLHLQTLSYNVAAPGSIGRISARLRYCSVAGEMAPGTEPVIVEINDLDTAATTEPRLKQLVDLAHGIFQDIVKPTPPAPVVPLAIEPSPAAILPPAPVVPAAPPA